MKLLKINKTILQETVFKLFSQLPVHLLHFYIY